MGLIKLAAKQGLNGAMKQIFPDSSTKAIKKLEERLKALEEKYSSKEAQTSQPEAPEAEAPGGTEPPAANPREELQEKLNQQVEDIKNELAADGKENDMDAFQSKFEEGAADRNDWFEQYAQNSGVPKREVDEEQEDYESDALKSKKEEIESDQKYQEEQRALDHGETDPGMSDKVREQIDSGTADPEAIQAYNNGDITANELDATLNPSTAAQAPGAAPAGGAPGVGGTADAAASTGAEAGAEAGAAAAAGGEVSAEELLVVLAL